jgi:DNA-binding NarL/FixJ family response regulator
MEDTVGWPESADRARAHGRVKTILLVDDSEHVRSVVRASLEHHGYKVCGAAADGVAAIEQAKKLKPDLIVMDLAMPLMNGVEAAAVLNRVMPKVPVVLLTIHSEQIQTPLAPGFGIAVVLAKADGMGKLLRTVQNLLGSPGSA